METYTLPQLPAAYRRVSVAYFADVSNAAEIKRELVRAATAEGPAGEAARQRVDFAFVEGDVIVSRLHLLTAVQTALLTSLPAPASTPSSSSSPTPPTSSDTAASPSVTAAARPSDAAPPSAAPPLKTKTHNIHSEVLLALNTNNNISDALRAYSVSDKTARLLVVRIGADGDTDEAALYARIADIVRGRLTSLDELEGAADWKRVDKLYKLAELNQALRATGERERLARKRAAVVSTVAVKPST